MKTVVQWLIAYRHRGAIAATALAGAPALMPFSVGLITLAALRGGAREGLLLTAIAVVALSLLQLVVQGALLLAVSTAALYWLPGVALAVILGRTRSLSLCLQLMTLLGVVVVVLFWVSVEGPAEWWLPLIEEAFLPWLTEVRPQGDFAPLMPAIARFFTGGLAAVWLLTMAAGLMLGRFWQGLAADEPVFGREFRAHRQGYAIGALAALVFVAAGLTGYALLQNLVLVLVAMFMLQGLSLVHWTVRRRGLHPGWLAVTYVLLPFGFPWSAVMLAATGFIDNWFQLRRRAPA